MKPARAAAMHLDPRERPRCRASSRSWRKVMAGKSLRIYIAPQLIVLVLIIVCAGCSNKSYKADTPSAKTFTSPDDAGNSLLAVARSGDQNAVLGIFGPGSKEIVFSADAVQDKATIAAFVTSYEA